MDKYSAHMVEAAKASGATAAQIQAKVQEAQKVRAIEDSVLMNAAMTFIEPFPVGLAITLISAGILRKKARPAESALAASR
jgi:hypothetical protein